MAFNNQFLRNMPPVTKNLLLVNILIFVVQVLFGAKESVLMNYCALHYIESPLFNPAQLFTYMFLHGGFTHLFFNMFALFMFGPQIEWALGPKRFLFYYISCGVGAALVQEGVFAVMVQKYVQMFGDVQYHQIIEQGAEVIKRGMNYVDVSAGALNALVNGPTVGASGAIYGVLLAFGMLFPNQYLMLMIPPMPIKAKWLVLGYGLLELFYGVAGANDGVAHFCHLGGMIIGIIIILIWKKKGTFNGYY